jgi:hypothetical protein
VGRPILTRVVAVAAAPAVALLAALAGPVSDVGARDSSPVAVRGLAVAVDRDLASQFGGRVDVTVRFRVVNTGGETLHPTARIELESQIGGGARSAPIELASLGPGEHVDVTRTAGSLLPFGSAHAVVTVRAADGVTTASASTPVVPWLLLLVVVVVVVAAVVARRTLRRRNLDTVASR